MDFQNKELPEIPNKTWLTGPAGSGKTTLGVGHLRRLLDKGIPADQILILTPQRSLAIPYRDLLRSAEIPSGGQVDVLTFNSLTQRCISLFWPMIARSAGFGEPIQSQPTYLTIETAQYHLAGLVRTKMETEGYFASLNLDPNRIFSQLLDNLNKSALVGFSYTEIGERLKSAWNGQSSQIRVFDQAQDCIQQFRAYCLEHNLLDYSLQIETFIESLWPAHLCRQYLSAKYRHLIFDNLEEDTPVVHDFLQDWLPELESALIITDQDGGYRQFLGADPLSAAQLAGGLPNRIELPPLDHHPRIFQVFEREFGKSLKLVSGSGEEPVADDLPERMILQTCHFFPEMLDWTANLVSELTQNEGIKPDQIAIISPFLPDTMRFSLGERLDRREIPYRTVRPSRSLREEPLVKCLLTLAKLAHPHWRMIPHKQDLILMLMQSIADLDPIRASILGEITYRKVDGSIQLSGFPQIMETPKARISYLIGERFEGLRTWLSEYQSRAPDELDIFFQRIFGELLTLPGYGFRNLTSAGEITANLIESARKFRQQLQPRVEPGWSTAQDYILALEQGLVAAQFVRSYERNITSSVVLSPAHTFLMQNQAVDVQIWLDIGSNGWWERLEQPLTHPYVLSRNWTPGTRWTDDEEYRSNQENMLQMVRGLLRRCNQKVYLINLEINEQGYDQQGMLLKNLHKTMVRLMKAGEHAA
jgi:hypothetical protein